MSKKQQLQKLDPLPQDLSSVEALGNWLERKGVSTEKYGRGDAKTLYQLWKEVCNIELE